MTEKNLIPLLRFPKFVRDAEWICTTLRAEMDYENGVAHENDIDSLGKYIVVNSKYISTEGQIEKRANNAHCLAEKNDILMVLSDLPKGKAIAKCFYVDASNKYIVNQRICKLRSKGANSKLLYYILNRNPYFLSFDDGVKQTNLRKEDVLNCPLILPKSLEEQDLIADCLSSIDSYISSINEKIEQLKAHKKSLMQKLFPQNGKTIPEYRFPEFEKDEVWIEKKLGSFLRVRSGYAFKSNTYINSGKFKIVTIRNVKNGRLEMGEYNTLNNLPADIQPHQILKRGDVLVSMTGNVGRVCKVDYDNCLLNQRVGLIEKYSNNIDEEFVFTVLTDTCFEKAMIESGQGAAQANISNKDIEEYCFLCPPNLNEQHQIASCLSPIERLMNYYLEKVTLLEQNRIGLTHQLFPQQQIL